MLLLLGALPIVGAQEDQDVDLLLVLAVDVSGSIKPERWKLQKSGYATAFRSAEVLRAIQSGSRGSIAVIFVQWSGQPEQAPSSLGWYVVKDRTSAEVFASHVEQMPRLFSGSTAIGEALRFCSTLFRWAPAKAPKHVIDISGDGRASYGGWTTQPEALSVLLRSRNEVIAQDITINALPLQGDDHDADNWGLKEYYENYVIGGPGAFSIFVKELDNPREFTEALKKKLVLEIAMLRN